jgi:hypothetical protein
MTPLPKGGGVLFYRLRAESLLLEAEEIKKKYLKGHSCGAGSPERDH